MISSFTGQYACFSNFYQAPMRFSMWGDMVELPDVEHGFQAFKAVHRKDAGYVLDAPTAAEAKRRGRMIECVTNWDETKRQCMLFLQIAKYRQNDDLRAILASTAKHPGPQLVEGNKWHDNYWGSCMCARCNAGSDAFWADHGQNYLGKILMATRMILC